MRKAASISFNTVGARQQFQPGAVALRPRTRIPYLGLEVTVPLKNATGGSASFTDAQVLAFLSGWAIDLGVGVKGRKVFNNLDLKTLFILACYAHGYAWPGTTDAVASSTGLKQTVANGATAAAKFIIEIPLGTEYQDDQFKDMGGVGVAQAATFDIALTRAADTLPASWTIDGSPSIQLLLPERPARFERWENIPMYVEPRSSSDVVSSADGLTLLYAEKSAPAASSTLTSVRVEVDGQAIHDGVDAKEIAADYNSDPALPAAGKVDTYWTPLVAQNTRAKLRERIPGVVTLTQISKDMASVTLAHYYRQPISESDWAEEVRNAASILKREVRAVSAAAAEGVDMPSELKPYYGIALLTPDEADSRDLESLRATAYGTNIHVPAAKATRIRVTAAAAGGNADHVRNVVGQVAANIPGGSPFKRGRVENSTNAFRGIADLVR